MLVSVITISYKDLDGLRRTIESVAQQETCTDIEHIVIDGGSGEQVEALLRSSVTVAKWVSGPDGGRYDAMNKGIALARGDLLWFMHSGDVFSSDGAVARVLEKLDHPRKLWGYGLARLVAKDGTPVGILGSVPFKLRQFMLGGKPVPHQAAFFGRDVIDHVGPYSLTHGLAADQLFILKAALFRAPVVIVDFVCNFDTSGAGSTRAWHKHYLDMARARKASHATALGSREADILATMLIMLLVAAKRGVRAALGRWTG